MSKETYRGPISNRGLTTVQSKRDGLPSIGNLELLGLHLEEVLGRRVLDVGIGGGLSFRHAVELGIDYSGVDLIPLIDMSELEHFKSNFVFEQKRAFEQLRREYPDRVHTFNFCTTPIPLEDNSFGLVLSAEALPHYARNPIEASLSLLNMISLAQEKVVVNCGWESTNKDGSVVLGVFPGTFRFQMEQFLEDLKRTININYQLLNTNHSFLSQSSPSISIDTTQKRTNELKSIYNGNLLNLDGYSN